MKRLIHFGAIVLAAVLLISLTSCSKGSSGADEQGTDSHAYEVRMATSAMIDTVKENTQFLLQQTIYHDEPELSVSCAELVSAECFVLYINEALEDLTIVSSTDTICSGQRYLDISFSDGTVLYFGISGWSADTPRILEIWHSAVGTRDGSALFLMYDD